MRQAVVVPVLLALLAAPACLRAQQVVDQSGAKTTGRVESFGRDGLVIRTDAGTRQFSEAAVRRVDRSGSSTLSGTLIGAGLGVLAGVALCDNAPSGASCPFLTGLVFGAPIGALVGAWVPSMHPLYRAPVQPASGRAVPAGGSKSRLVEELAMAVNLDDPLIVESATGQLTEGFLMSLGEDGLTLNRNSVAQLTIRLEAVRRVSVERGHAKLGTLLGLAAFTALCNPTGPNWLDAVVLCGFPGAGVGALVGRAVRTSTVVYPVPSPRLSVAPALVHRRVGVRASYRF